MMAVKNPYGTLGPSPSRVAKVNKAKAKPKPKPKPNPRATAGPIRPLKPPTRSAVDVRLDAEFNPLMEALLFERKQNQDYNSRLMHDLGGFTNAVMGRLGGIAPQIGNAYAGAAGAQGAMGDGYGAILNRDQAADAGRVNDVLGTIGAPEGQKLSGGDAGGVLAGLAGWIPSQMLQSQGDALAGAAANLPNNASIQAQIEMHKLLGQAKEEDSEFGEQVRQLLAKKPGLRAEIQASITKDNLAVQKMQLDQFNDDRNYWLKMQAYYQSVGKLKLSQQAAKRAQQAENRYANASAGLDAWGNVAPGYVRQPDGTIVKRYKPAAPAKGKGAAGLTPNAKSEILQRVLNQEDDIVKKALPNIGKSSGLDKLLTGMGPPVPAKLKAARAKAIKLLWERYSGAATTPESKKALRKMLTRIVRDYAPTSGGSGLTDGLGL
jgi:hypothetical protein